MGAISVSVMCAPDGRTPHDMPNASAEPLAVPISFGRIATDAWETFRSQPGRIIALAVLFFAPLALIDTLLTQWTHNFDSSHPGWLGAAVIAVLGIGGTALLGEILFVALLEQLVGEVHHGHEALPVWPLMRTLPWARLLLAELILLALSVTLVGGIVGVTLFGIVGPVLRIERRKLFDGFERSARLTWRHLALVLMAVTAPLYAEHAVLEWVSAGTAHLSLAADYALEVAVIVVVSTIVGLFEVALTYRLIHRYPPQAPGPSRAATIRRVVTLAVFGVSLYVVLPSVLALYGEVPKLRGIGWWWFPVLFALEATSFWCLWQLQRIALVTRRLFDVACSQLAANAVSRAVPGGAAAGGVMQYQMLAKAGLDSSTVTSALTAAGLLDTTALFALPVLALPAVILGQGTAPPLVRGALLAAGFFVVISGLGAVLLRSDRVVLGAGRLVGRLARRFKRSGGTDPDAMANRALKSRNLVRSELAGSWQRAVPAALGNQLFDLAALQVAVVAVGGEFRPAQVLLCYVAAATLAMIPLTPGGIGFVEAGLTGLLTLSGVANASQAVLATLLYRVFSYWLTLPSGAVASFLFKRRHPDVEPRPVAEVTTPPAG